MAKNKYSCSCGCSSQLCDCEIIHKSVVDKTRKKMLDVGTLKMMTDFYKSFADSTRLRIIDILQNHEMCVCDISVLLNMTKSAISHQLKYLRQLNIVKARKDGKIVYYSLADKHVNEIYEVCLNHVLEESNE